EVFVSALGPPVSVFETDATTRAFSWQFTRTAQLNQSVSDATAGAISDVLAGVAAGMNANAQQRQRTASAEAAAASQKSAEERQAARIVNVQQFLTIFVTDGKAVRWSFTERR